MRLTFHRLLQKDLRSALSYYDEVAGPQLAGRLYDEFESLVATIEQNPRRFHGCRRLPAAAGQLPVVSLPPALP